MRMLSMMFAALVLAGCGTAEPAVDGGSTEAADEAAAAANGESPPAQSDAPSRETLADASGEVGMTIAATVDGRRYAAEGRGECKHAADAYIYGVPSAMWLVQYRGEDVRSLSLTLWRPKSGEPDMLSLNLATGDRTSSISTVGRGEPAGSATARLEIDGPGGRFLIEGRDEEGNDVTLDVRCSRFGTVEAVGG